MTTERFDIIVTEKGAREVQRNIENIGTSATKTENAVSFLKKTLGLLGVGLGLNELRKYADTYTILTNNIRNNTKSLEDQIAVEARLFQIAQRNRQSLESTGQVYDKLIVVARDLGVTQNQLLDFVDATSAAFTIQGGSAEISNRALNQLFSIIRSGNVDAGELTGILRSFPRLAQAMADGVSEAGGSVAKLTSLIEQGKVSPQNLFGAVTSQLQDLREEAARTTPTIAGAFTVLENSLTRFIGQLDQGAGLSAIFGKGIITLADNVDILAKSLIIVTAAWGTYFSVTEGEQLVQSFIKIRQLYQAVASGNAILLGSAAAERARAAAATDGIKAELAATQATLARINAERAKAIVLVGSTEAEFARAAVLKQVAALEAIQATQTNALAAANARLATATAASSGFLARLTGLFPPLGAGIAYVLKGIGSLFALLLANPLTALVTTLVAATSAAILFGDKITLSEDGVVTLRDVMVGAWTAIKEAIAQVADFLGVAFVAALNSVGLSFDVLRDVMNNTLAFAKSVVNLFIAVWVSAYQIIVAAFKNLGSALKDIFTQALNGVLKIVQDSLNFIIEGINKLTSFTGIEVGRVDFEALKNENAGAAADFGKEVGGIIGENAKKDFLGEFGNAFVELGRAAAEERKRREAASGATGLDTPLGAGGVTLSKQQADSFKQLQASLDPVAGAMRAVAEAQDLINLALRAGVITASEASRLNDLLLRKYKDQLDPLRAINEELDRQADLLGQTDDQRAISNQLYEITKQLQQQGIILTGQETEALTAKLVALQQLNKESQIANAILKELNGPAEDYANTLKVLQKLVGDGSITQEQYNQKLRDARIAMLDTATDGASGFERGILKAQKAAGDLADLMEGAVTSAINHTSDALAEFAMTGEFNFKKLVNSILADITRLASQQVSSQLFGLLGGSGGGSGGGGGLGGIFSSLFGGGSGGGGLFSGIGSLFGFETGGSFAIPGTGGPDSQLVAFRGSPGETVKVTKPGQGDVGSPGGTQIVMNIYGVSDAESFKRSEGQITQRLSATLNRSSRRNG